MRYLIDVWWCKWVMGGALLVGLAGPVWAGRAVKCQVICADGKECKTSDRPSPVKGSWTLDDCEHGLRKVDLGCANVWYFSNHTPKLARVCKDAQIASALVEPDFSCGILDCLMPSPPKAVPGANPIGRDGESSTSSGARAGLPFDTILAPSGVFRLSALGSTSETTGVFTLWDAGTKRLVVQVPIQAGIATLPPAAIDQESSYRYRWQAGSQTLEGSFMTTSIEANAEVQPAAGSGSPAMSAEQRQWTLVHALSTLGYAWDATQAALALQKTQAAAP